MFQEDCNFHTPIIRPTLDTQTPPWGYNKHLPKKHQLKTDRNFQPILDFFLVTQEVRDWQLVILKLRPEQRIQMNLVGMVVLPYSKQKKKKTLGGETMSWIRADVR